MKSVKKIPVKVEIVDELKQLIAKQYRLYLAGVLSGFFLHVLKKYYGNIKTPLMSIWIGGMLVFNTTLTNNVNPICLK